MWMLLMTTFGAGAILSALAVTIALQEASHFKRRRRGILPRAYRIASGKGRGRRTARRRRR